MCCTLKEHALSAFSSGRWMKQILAWEEKRGKSGDTRSEKCREKMAKRSMVGNTTGEHGREREFDPRLPGDNLQNCLARTARFCATNASFSADDPRMIIVPRRYVPRLCPLSMTRNRDTPTLPEGTTKRRESRGFLANVPPIVAPNI